MMHGQKNIKLSVRIFAVYTHTV